jgi:hypothetical protein
VTVKRRRPESAPVPEQYARFVRSEWPAELSCEDAVNQWHTEREAWAQENLFIFMGYLDSPIGDMLDRLRARREARLLNCCQPEAEPEESNGHRTW